MANIEEGFLSEAILGEAILTANGGRIEAFNARQAGRVAALAQVARRVSSRLGGLYLRELGGSDEFQEGFKRALYLIEADLAELLTGESPR